LPTIRYFLAREVVHLAGSARTSYLDPDGTPSRRIGIPIDITERKQAE